MNAKKMKSKLEDIFITDLSGQYIAKKLNHVVFIMYTLDFLKKLLPI